MRLSALQKYILIICLQSKDKVLQSKLTEYYLNRKSKPKLKDQITVIHKSINSLIDNGALIGYGKRTKEKWFYSFIKLSPLGKKLILNIYKDRQQKLPLKK